MWPQLISMGFIIWAGIEWSLNNEIYASDLYAKKLFSVAYVSHYQKPKTVPLRRWGMYSCMLANDNTICLCINVLEIVHNVRNLGSIIREIKQVFPCNKNLQEFSEYIRRRAYT